MISSKVLVPRGRWGNFHFRRGTETTLDLQEVHT